VGVVVIALASLLMLSRLIGCGGGNQNAPIPAAADHGDPAEFLQRMVDKYQQAASYGDHGVLTLNLVRHGKAARPQTWPFAVQFVRPGRLRVDSYNLHLASDATAAEPLLIAQVDDAESNNIDHQVVVRPAPPEAKFSALNTDPILFAQLIGRTGRPPAPLELLLDQRPLATLLAKDAKLAWLADSSVQGHNCYRIEYTAAEGKYVFWIDAEELLLRRLEYPAAALLPDLAGDKAVTEAHLIAELVDATFAPKAEELAFTLPIPPDAKRMRAFVMPVIALDAKLLGQPVRTFELTQVDGEKITPAKMKGKITALFWYAHHAACEQPARQFAEAAKQLDEDQQAFIVCTELADVGDKAVRDQLAAWKVDLPPARDLKQYHERIFQVRELPAITLLDAEGRFQWMGSGQSAAVEFPEALARLARGEDLAAEALRREFLAQEEYQRLVAAGGPRLDTGLAAASSPKRLKLTRKWKSDELTAGGTILAAADRLLVVAGPRSVWEIDADSKVLARHDLPLPEKVEITSLRSFQGAEGKPVYAVFSPLQAGVHVLDADWMLLFSYPDGEDQPPVRDVQLADLDENGEPELLVAFDGSVGLHSVSMSGERLWSNRAYTPLVSLALSHKLPKVGYSAYATGRGGISPTNKDGFEGLPKDVPGWVVAHLFSSRFGDTTETRYAAIAADAKGEPCLVGLDKVLEEKWNYPLPGGAFQRPVDFLTSGKLRADSKGEWIVAWSDGSIHIISEDGNFDDTFNTGAEIRGVAFLEREGQPLLVVSTPKEVLAWEVGE
jgi:hypothetical protein